MKNVAMGTNQDEGIQNCSYANLTVTILLVAALLQSHISFKLTFCKKMTVQRLYDHF